MRYRVLAIAAATLFAVITVIQPSVARASSTVTSVVVNFRAGETSLNANQKAQIDKALDEAQTSSSVIIMGYALGKRVTAASTAIARTRAQKVEAELLAGGLNARVTLLTPKITTANKVVIQYTSGTRYLWSQEFAGASGGGYDPKNFYGLVGDGSDQLGLATYGTGEIEQNDPRQARLDGSGNLDIKSVLNRATWKSARIWTANKIAFQYGKLEIRAKFPVGSFNWPAIWMLGNDYQPPNGWFGTTQWPGSGELDIAEGLGQNSVDQGTLHGLDGGGDWRGGAGVTAVAPLQNISDTFHVWGIEWQPNQVKFTLDGSVFATDTFANNVVTQTLPNGSSNVFDSHGNWPYNQPFFLILNNAIPAGTSAADGASSDFLIDYIRYSKFNGYGQVVRP
jgi:beta-glucanase (GH16 family)